MRAVQALEFHHTLLADLIVEAATLVVEIAEAIHAVDRLTDRRPCQSSGEPPTLPLSIERWWMKRDLIKMFPGNRRVPL